MIRLAQVAREHLDGHVPDGLCYGPVSSRRFGRSLGVSFSEPGAVACRWHCPYCQLGRQRPAMQRHAAADEIIAATTARLAKIAAGELDSVTFAGNGEPLDHPEFARIAAGILPAVHAHGAAAVLLSNGDGVQRECVRAALADFDRCYIKWDPGARDGAWRSPGGGLERGERLRSLPGLRIQAMLFRSTDGPGNCSEASRQAWIAELAQLAPIEVHLTTIERDPADPRLLPVERFALARWRRVAQRRLGVPVTAFPARSA